MSKLPLQNSRTGTEAQMSLDNPSVRPAGMPGRLYAKVNRLRRKLSIGRTKASQPGASNGSIDQQSVRNLVTRSGLFSAEWYLDNYPDVRVAQVDPWDHYLHCGAFEGRDPSPLFSSNQYFKLSGLDPLQQINPLVHYLLQKPFASVTTKGPFLKPFPSAEEFPDPFILREIEPRASIAVVVHVYYIDVWPTIAAHLSNLKQSFDLIVTISAPDYISAREQIISKFPNAWILRFPNHGRDVFPFVYLVNCGLLGKYDLVCKLHTKKSMHREDGAAWCHQIVGSLLQSPQVVDQVVETMVGDTNIGVVGADGNVYNQEHWGINTYGVQKLCDRISLQFLPDHIRFAAGTMFWASRFAIKIIESLMLTVSDFEPEDGQLDGRLCT